MRDGRGQRRASRMDGPAQAKRGARGWNMQGLEGGSAAMLINRASRRDHGLPSPQAPHGNCMAREDPVYLQKTSVGLPWLYSATMPAR
jgi:hypothetical protein